MRSIGGAVGQRQIADANTDGVFLHFNHRVTIAAGHLQHLAYWVVIIGMYPKARTVCILKYPIDGPIPFLRFCFSRHDFFRRNRMVIVRSAHIALNSA